MLGDLTKPGTYLTVSLGTLPSNSRYGFGEPCPGIHGEGALLHRAARRGRTSARSPSSWKISDRTIPRTITCGRVSGASRQGGRIIAESRRAPLVLLGNVPHYRCTGLGQSETVIVADEVM